MENQQEEVSQLPKINIVKRGHSFYHGQYGVGEVFQDSKGKFYTVGKSGQIQSLKRLFKNMQKDNA